MMPIQPMAETTRFTALPALWTVLQVFEAEVKFEIYLAGLQARHKIAKDRSVRDDMTGILETHQMLFRRRQDVTGA